MEDEDLRFAHFRLDSRRRELRAGAKPVALQSRALDILDYLIRHRDRAVSRDEILQEVYQDRTVSPGNVPVQIAAIRTALSRAGGDPKLIVTTGSAYRFTGDILAPDFPAPLRDPPVAAPLSPPLIAPRRARRPWLLGLTAIPLAAAVALAVLLWPHRQAAARLSFAVLPFRNITGDAAQDFRAEGITDELNADLAYIPAATVIARESAVAYQDKHLPIPEIGRALHVHYIVAGDLGLEDGAWRVHPRLIDADTGTEAWSASLTFPKSQEGELTPTIAAAIASSLNTTIDQLEASRAVHDHPDNPDAVDLLYQARALLDADDDAVTSGRAEALLEAALARQPDFSDALAALGYLLVHRIQTDPVAFNNAGLDRADALIARALALAPASAEALAARAAALEVAEKCPGAEYYALSALKIAFSNIHAQSTLRNCAWEQGQLDLAMEHIAALERLDPAGSSHPGRLIMKAHIQLLQGNAAEAAATLHGVVASYPLPSHIEVNPSQRAIYARILLTAALAMTGQGEGARELYRSYSAQIPHVSGWRLFVSYQSRAISNLRGTGRIIQALQSAGLSEYADASALPGAACHADGSEFAPTPEREPGVAVAATTNIPEILRDQRPIVVDVGLGVAAIRGAKWTGATSSTAEMLAALDRLVSSLPEQSPLLVMGDGPFGCNGYLAAAHLAASGRTHVIWYRGGEEAWSGTGQPADDHREY